MMTLVIDRDKATKTFTFPLARASEVAETNHKRLYQGRMIPSVGHIGIPALLGSITLEPA
jgi:hypothetical protein